MTPLPLAGVQIVSIAGNLPGPLAACRLSSLGARVVKVEPPDGDLLQVASPEWYRSIHANQEVVRLDLKQAPGREWLEARLAESDLLITSQRLAALERLGLSWDRLHAAYPRLCQVAIVGYLPPDDHLPGHDLTYQAGLGMIRPDEMPVTLIADLAGAEQAVSAALALLLGREKGQPAGYIHVSLAKAAKDFAVPLHLGATLPGGALGGGLPGYRLYQAREGWVAVAALEPHFWLRLVAELGLDSSSASADQLQAAFLERTAAAWETWAAERDLPVVAVREVSQQNLPAG